MRNAWVSILLIKESNFIPLSRGVAEGRGVFFLGKTHPVSRRWRDPPLSKEGIEMLFCSRLAKTQT